MMGMWFPGGHHSANLVPRALIAGDFDANNVGRPWPGQYMHIVYFLRGAWARVLLIISRPVEKKLMGNVE